VEDGSDRWVPPVGDSKTWDPLVSEKKRGEGMLAWGGKGKLGCCPLGPERRRRGERKVQGLQAENREGESFFFFSVSLFF